MTAQDRPTIKAKFEQGDTPQGSDYVDWIDSTLFTVETTAQALASPLNVTGAIGASTTVSAATVEASAATFTTVSAQTASFDILLVAGESIVAPSQAIAVGELFATVTADFQTSTAGAFSIISGTFSSESTLQNDTSASATLMEIEYTGTATARFFATANISMKASGNNKLASMRIGVNASSLSRSQIRRFVASTTDVGAANVSCIVMLNPNDKASVMMSNFTDTVGFAITDIVFNLVEQ